MWCVLFTVDGVGRAARAGDVASAGAAGLRAETCVARGAPGDAASPQVAMYPSNL